MHTVLKIFLVAALAVTALAGAPRTGLGAGAKVLFDEGHGQQFLIGRQGELDLSSLAQILREHGAETEPLSGPISPGTLAGARALVISGPFKSFSQDEIEAIARFVEEGGRLSLMLHIPQPVQGLMQRLGVNAWNGVVSEEEQLVENSPQDFFVSRFEPHPLTDGLERFAVYGTWSVTSFSRHAMVIARTGPKAWLDTNRDHAFTPGELRDSFGIVVHGALGEGAFAVFGDDAIFQNRFLEAQNRPLAENLSRWLVR